MDIRSENSSNITDYVDSEAIAGRNRDLKTTMRCATFWPAPRRNDRLHFICFESKSVHFRPLLHWLGKCSEYCADI